MIPMNTCWFILYLLFFLCFSININLSQGTDSITANEPLSGSQTIVSSGNIFELGFFAPGSSLAYDKRTKTKKVLISWKNSEDPAPGLFSFELDPNGSQVIIRWNRTEWYWTSGAWNGLFFSLIPEMRLNNMYNHTYFDSVNESYYTYSLYNPSIKSRYVMDVSGQIRQTSWNTKEWNLIWFQPSQQCDVYAYCGAFGTCNQNSLHFCYCLPGFKQRSENDWNLKDYSGGCEREIILNCTNDRKDKFLPNNLVRLPAKSQSLMAGSAGECESICLSNCSCTAYSYNGNACLVWNGELMDLKQPTENDGNEKMIYIRLSASASQFSSTKKGKGVVIGAVVGSVAAVMVLLTIVMICIRRKRISRTTKEAEGSLAAFGYKDDLQIATKNFSGKLGGDDNSGIGVPICSWESIIAATKNFSDAHKLGRGGFGPVYKGMFPEGQEIALKRIVEGKGTEASTKKVIGTYGYMSPEYASDGIFSIKSDVFSFGVVVLEIVTGKKNTGFYQSTEDLNLLGYVWRLWSENKALDIVDPLLLESCEKSEVIKCINVGLLCVEEDPSNRPTMSNVVFMLSGEIAVLPVPKQPAFVMRKRSSYNQPASFSNNELTVSMPQGR
ncbi:unnamed protein product [Fraxinus pennsylvanica]|uniref:Apple domain-containing protein n=1 Tax=Fraxinus pennsylvanica TaxID=56036 RepID=A0AAD1YYP4_9LAMI|nr:unnamed protein product [Fraxinus pennsylvanica]